MPGRTNDNALGMSGFLAFAMGEMEPSIDAVRPLVYYAPTPTRQWQALQKMPYGILGEHALQYNHEPDRNADRKQADVTRKDSFGSVFLRGTALQLNWKQLQAYLYNVKRVCEEGMI